MKILVIGRTGQVAQSLAEQAALRGDVDLVLAGRERIDLERPDTIGAAVAEERPDVVVNAAAYTSVDDAEGEEAQAFAVNAKGAADAAGASRDYGARFIHLSTDYVFDGTGEAARDECAPTAPISAYGRSKLAGEEAVRDANPEALIVRSAWVYSPFGRNFVRRMMRLAEGTDEIRVVGDQRGNPTNALDLADGILVAASKGWRRGGTYHLAGSGAASWAEFASQIMSECERLDLPSARIVPISSRDYPTRAERPKNSMLDCRRFGTEFGFSMPLWRDSLPAVIERIGRL